MNKSVILQDEAYACIDKGTHKQKTNKNENAKKNTKEHKNENTKNPPKKNEDAYLKKETEEDAPPPPPPKKNENKDAKFKLSIVEYCICYCITMHNVLFCALIQYTYNNPSLLETILNAINAHVYTCIQSFITILYLSGKKFEFYSNSPLWS